MTTPIPQILLAVEGKMHFVGKTNPFGAPKPKKDDKLKAQRSKFALLKAEAREKAKDVGCYRTPISTH